MKGNHNCNRYRRSKWL